MNQPTLKTKVVISYIILAIAVAGIAIFNVSNIQKAASAIDSSDWAFGLHARMLDVTGLEKSYFLYKSQADYNRLAALITELEGMLEKPAGQTGQAGASLLSTLKQYRGLLEVYSQFKEVSDESFIVEEMIKEQSKSALSAAGEIAEQNTAGKRLSMAFTMKSMIASAAVLLVMAGGFWFVFHRKFVRPITMGAYTLVPLLEYNRYKTDAVPSVEAGMQDEDEEFYVRDDVSDVEKIAAVAEPKATIAEDVQFEGARYNVRTFDLGPEEARIKTDVIRDGHTIMSRVVGYDEVGTPGMAAANRVAFQHKAIVMGINLGKLKNRSEI